ncbi:tubulin-folding cofactor B-like [Anopheles maculipalpis]|uniref:tubulin-folding cofactor B-like n=1 Tax=Anopheles maculipalpis TaxID=1496333 RepID=UPI002158C977|nr:tubulin-folding cofactor B-like [Anopheles maculipalpis]
MADLIHLHITNSQNDAISYDRKLDPNTPIAELKNLLEFVTGVSAYGMQLELYNNDKFVMKIIEQGEHKLLGDFPIQHGMRLHVIGHCTWLDDGGADKFELSPEQYDSRQDSLRNYLRQNKLGRYNEHRAAQKMAARARSREEQEKKLRDATVGKRCKVMTKCAPSRLGTIAYQGKLEGKAGIFLGVKFDEPVGVNDGTFEGKRYFECAPKYGSFVTVDAIELVDLPPEECLLDDEL